MRCDILIQNCKVLTPDFTIESDKSVAIADTKIMGIHDAASAAELYEPEQVLEAGGKLLMPGFVDAHTHTCQQLLRGRITDEYPMIWTRFLVPFESGLTKEEVRTGARLACLEMIKAGFTAFADAGGVHMEQVAEAVIESGMRAALCRSAMDMGPVVTDSMKESWQDCISRTEELYQGYQGKGEGRVDIWFGIRQVMTCSPQLIEKTAEKASQYHTGIHAHLCEHKDEVSFCLQNYKKRPVEFLEQIGVLGPNLLTAHNVLLTERDIRILAKHKVKLAHCPHANLTNHGFPKTPSILENGISLGIGCDGASNISLDMFDEMRTLKNGILAYWGLPAFDPEAMPTRTLLAMATAGGANALGHGDELGVIAPGKKADLILMDVHRPHLYPTQNLLNTIVDAGKCSDITDSIINGRLVMRNRQVLTLDEEQVMDQCARHMEQIIKRGKG